MSVECSVCYEVVAQPNSLWYAVIRTHILSLWICGDCLARIPQGDRVPTETQNEKEVTFGPVRADVNSRGWYQMHGSSQMTPRFWVPMEVLEKHYTTPCELMTTFFPLVRMERCLKDTLRADQEGVWPPWPWEVRTREHFLMENHHEIRAFLGFPPSTGEKHAVNLSLDGIRHPLQPALADRAEELWNCILEWGKPPSTR